MVLLIVLCRVGFAFESVAEITSCGHSDSCKLLVFFLFSLEGCFESVDKAVNCDHHKIKILPEQ